MAIRNIIRKGDEILNKISKPVTVFDKKLHTLLDDMQDTMFEANGVGLAAPQIAVLKRIAVVLNCETEEVYELINPEILSKKNEFRDIEGCLSLPGVYGYVTRPQTVTVRAQDRFGKFYEVTGENLLARAFSHEIDHLDGKLFDDLVEEYLDPEELE